MVFHLRTCKIISGLIDFPATLVDYIFKHTATMLPPLCPPTEIDHAPQSTGFLDLPDNGKDSACSSKQRMPTPDRPQMFPRKLY